MLHTSKRIARRPPLPPPATPDLKKRSELFQLTASDTKNGNAVMAGTGTGWRLDELTASSDSGWSSSKSIPRMQRAAAREFASVSDEQRPSTDSSSCSSSFPAPAPAKKPPPQKPGDNSLKLIPYDQLKAMIQGNCVCKECHSPLIMTQETFGIATNINLFCVPCDKR